jgi:tRNA 2-thiouridine synthesizing protein C
MSKSHLFLFRRPPLAGAMNLEALDAALVAAAFDLPTTLLFLDDAVLQLAPAVAHGDSPGKSIARQLSVLPEYGIDQVHACAHALARHDLNPAALTVKTVALEGPALAALIRSHAVVLND